MKKVLFTMILVLSLLSAYSKSISNEQITIIKSLMNKTGHTQKDFVDLLNNYNAYTMIDLSYSDANEIIEFLNSKINDVNPQDSKTINDNNDRNTDINDDDNILDTSIKEEVITINNFNNEITQIEINKINPYDVFSIGINQINILQSATFYQKYHQNYDMLYGFDFFRFSINSSYEETIDYNNSLDETNASDGKLSIALLMPRLGFRKNFKKSNLIHSYNQIESYMILPLLKTSGDAKLDSKSEKEIKENLNLLGIKISHSIEYNINKHLSLVADVGVNWIFWDNIQKNEYEGSNYIERSENEINTNLSLTYTKLSIHFKL